LFSLRSLLIVFLFIYNLLVQIYYQSDSHSHCKNTIFFSFCKKSWKFEFGAWKGGSQDLRQNKTILGPGKDMLPEGLNLSRLNIPALLPLGHRLAAIAHLNHTVVKAGPSYKKVAWVERPTYTHQKDMNFLVKTKSSKMLESSL
jgi:hypothetical protein